jgi:hypothetical protein
MGLISRLLGIEAMLSMHEGILREVLRTAQIQAEAARLQAEAAMELSKHMWKEPDGLPERWISSPDIPFEPDVRLR